MDRLTWLAVVAALVANAVLLSSAAVTARAFASWRLRPPLSEWDEATSVAGYKAVMRTLARSGA